MPRQRVFAGGASDSLEEKEADCFAMCLLMPRLLVKKFHPYYSSSDLANIFNVTRILMEKRLKEIL